MAEPNTETVLVNPIESAMDELHRHYVPTGKEPELLPLVSIIGFLDSCGIPAGGIEPIQLREQLRANNYQEQIIDHTLVFKLYRAGE